MAMTVTFSGGTPRYQFQWLVAINKWADTVGPFVLAELKAAAPVATGPNAGTGNHAPGTLKRSIRYSRKNTPGNISLLFVGYAPYTQYVVSGTKAHKIFPNTKRYLHFYNKNGGDVFVGPKGSAERSAYVEHRGTAANPFATRVMERVASDVQRVFNEIMTEALGSGAEE